jgi:hypothetical protein
MTRTRRQARLIAVVSALLSTAALAQATVVAKEASGEAAIIGSDEQRAFEEAKKSALRTAIEAAAGVRIDADTAVVNNQLVRDQVFANTSGYVKKFDVVSKAVDPKKKTITVVVKAEIITENLDRDITAARDLIKRAGRPSIIIMVNEQTLQLGDKGGASAITTSDTMATVLTRRFKSDGWDIKDPAFASGKVRVAPGATLGAAEAKEIGDLSKSAFILYGSATIRNQDFPTKDAEGRPVMFMVTGEYDLTLFATDVGTQIGKFSGKLTFNQQSDAAKVKVLISYERTAFDLIQARAEEISTPLRAAVLEHFRNRQVNGVELEMSVVGLESFGVTGQFRKSLEALKGLKEVEQKDFGKGRALFRVTFLGTPAELAEAVEQATFKKRKLEVTAVTSNSIEISVGK